jgi:hypothetical protein
MGMKARCSKTLLVLPVGLLWLLGSPWRGAAADPHGGESESQIVVAADYPRSHVVYAAAQPDGCQAPCRRLLRSDDGGGSWRFTAARGWNGGNLAVASVDGSAALVSLGSGSVGLSRDRGETFTEFRGPGQGISSAADGDAIDVAIEDGGGSASLLSLPSGVSRAVPGGTGLSPQMISLSTAYPHPPPGVPAGVSLGVDRGSGTAQLEPCDGALACSRPVLVPSGGEVLFSPAFARDLTFFFLGTQGMMRSGDGGRTLQPVAVAPSTSGTVVTTVVGLAFSADFDATASRGALYAAVVSVSRGPQGASLGGGVYRSRDDGITWSRMGGAGDLPQGAGTVAVAPDGRVYAGAFSFGSVPGGIHCSADGATWTPSCAPYPAGGHNPVPSAGGQGSAGAALPAAGSRPGQSPLGPAAETSGTGGRGGTAAPVGASLPPVQRFAPGWIAFAAVVLALGGWRWRRRGEVARRNRGAQPASASAHQEMANNQRRI